MKTTEAALLADRVVNALRWLTLITLCLFFAWGKGIDTIATILLATTCFWNLFLSIFSMFNRRMPFHNYLAIAIDLFLGILFFIFTSSPSIPAFPAAILPLLTASVYYGWQGGLLISIVTTVLEFFLLLFSVSPITAVELIIIPVFVIAAVGIALGYGAQYFGRLLRDQPLPRADHSQPARRMTDNGPNSDQLKAIYQIATSLGSTLNYEQVLDMSLDLTANAFSVFPGDSSLLVSAFFLYRGEKMHLGSARRFPPSDMKATLSGEAGLIGRALSRGESLSTKDPASDPEISRIIALRECGVVYIYPLCTSSERYGVLIFGHPDQDYFDDQRVEILEIVGRQAHNALQNALLYNDLVEEQARMIEIQEEARKKLARNLHDGPTQSVAALAMRVNFARRLMEKDATSASEELYKIEELARRTTKEIRHMLFTLRPLVLESAGLIPALESMAEKMRDTYGQNVIIQADQAVVEKMDQGKQGVVFYIAEEAVNNARKHAEAVTIWVRLKPVEEEVALLEIEDDGVGFNVGSVDTGYENRGSLGMVNMRERAELLSGLIKIDSVPGKGTRIQVYIPLTEDAATRLRHG